MAVMFKNTHSMEQALEYEEKSRGVGATIVVCKFGDYEITLRTMPEREYLNRNLWGKPNDSMEVERCYRMLRSDAIEFRAMAEIYKDPNRYRRTDTAMLGKPATAHSVYAFIEHSTDMSDLVMTLAEKMTDPWLTSAASLWNVERLAYIHETGLTPLDRPSKTWKTWQVRPAIDPSQMVGEAYANY